MTRQISIAPCKIIHMTNSGDLRVSSRGQMSLPSAARHRWGLDVGGDIGFIDMGEVIVIVPGGIHPLRSALLASVTDDDWNDVRSGLGDAELANE